METDAVSLFLEEAELIELSGFKMKSRQIAWLQAQGLRHFVNAAGKPVVVRSVYEAWRNPPPPPEPVRERWVPPLPPEWHTTPLGRWQKRERENRAAIAAEASAARAALPKLSPDELQAQELQRVRAAALARAALVRFHANKRRTVKLRRTPAWADQTEIRKVYLEAQRLTRDTGIPHHVDHEIPLQGKLVSGLHVHNNLQIITGLENSRKHNKFEVDA